MTTALLLLLSFWPASSSSSPDPGRDDRAFVADPGAEPGSTALTGLVEGEPCPAVLEKTGGSSGSVPVSREARRAGGPIRSSTSAAKFPPPRPLPIPRLRC